MPKGELGWRDLLDAAGEPMFVHDRTGRFIEVNRHACKTLRYTRAELLAKQVTDVECALEAAELRDLRQRLRRGEPRVVAGRYRRKDGTTFPVKVRFAPVGDTRADPILAIARTARRGQEADETSIQTLIDAIPTRIALLDGTGAIRATNAHWNAFASGKLSPAGSLNGAGNIEVAEAPAQENGLGTPESLAAIRTWLRGKGTPEPIAYSCRFQHVTRWFMLYAAPVKIGGIRTLTAHWDITEQKLAERGAQAFGDFLVHDLRAPLRAVTGHAQLLLSECAAGLTEEGRHHMDRICAGAARMQSLIDKLRDLSRAKRRPLAIRRIDISAIMAEVAEELRSGSPERQVSFLIPRGFIVNADLVLVRDLLTNLLENAWKFTRDSPSARIELGRSEELPHVYFIRDNGCGFDMRFTDKMFEPFERLHSRAEFEGSGIGLAAARDIVTRHGGRIWAEGTPGRGATFYFTLG